MGDFIEIFAVFGVVWCIITVLGIFYELGVSREVFRLSQTTPKALLSRCFRIFRISSELIIENSDHEYFAYVKSICGKANYFLYFTDDIWGAVVLNNFVEMLRRFFVKENVKLRLQDKTIQLKN